MSSTLQKDIEDRLATAEPEVEVLSAEVVGGVTVRLFIDHPEGVSLDLCERVTHHLAHVREAGGRAGARATSTTVAGRSPASSSVPPTTR
jgi:ribosome maturation factor RimP